VGSHKDYKGYKAYDYLDPGEDYAMVPLAQEINRVPSYTIPTTEDQEARAVKLLKTSTVISMHDHPSLLPEDLTYAGKYRREGRDHIGYEGLSNSFLDATFDNLMNGTSTVTSKMGWKWDDIIYDIGMKLCDIAHQDFITVGKSVKDIHSAYENGQLALFLALEAATPVENEVDKIDILYGLGVRMMGIVYSKSNQLGSGQREERDGGLTHFGHQVVNRMNKIGMAIDISHAGAQTQLDVIKANHKPSFISHGCARGLCRKDMPNHKRCATDDVLKACAQSGGVIGIVASPHSTITVNKPEHTIDSIMEHFEYVKNLVGIDYVTFGPDTLFGDHVGLDGAFAKQLSMHQQLSTTSSKYPRVPYVKGMENPSEAFPNIVRWLVVHSYTDEEIRKIIGGNALRVLGDVWLS
jgi:membrane dipeptidase